jgi:hypothetical protein
VAHYKVLVRGENFVFLLDNEPTRLGFYATRFVEAKSYKAAEILALDLVRHDKKLGRLLNARDDPPMLFIDELDEVPASNVENTPGFTFFPADSNSKT